MPHIYMRYPTMTFVTKAVFVSQEVFDELKEGRTSRASFIWENMTGEEQRFFSEESIRNANDVGYADIEYENPDEYDPFISRKRGAQIRKSC